MQVSKKINNKVKKKITNQSEKRVVTRLMKYGIKIDPA